MMNATLGSAWQTKSYFGSGRNSKQLEAAEASLARGYDDLARVLNYLVDCCVDILLNT